MITEAISDAASLALALAAALARATALALAAALALAEVLALAAALVLEVALAPGSSRGRGGGPGPGPGDLKHLSPRFETYLAISSFSGEAYGVFFERFRDDFLTVFGRIPGRIFGHKSLHFYFHTL